MTIAAIKKLLSLDEFIEQIRRNPDVDVRPPLPENALLSLALAIRDKTGLQVPADYLRLLRVTDGLQTDRGDLEDLETILDQNENIWLMQPEAGVSADGDFEIRHQPLKHPKSPTYLWLGYSGNVAQQLYDLATGEYRQTPLGEPDRPFNRDRSLAGLLRYMVYRGDESSL